MKRRQLLKSAGLLTAGMASGIPVRSAFASRQDRPLGLALRIAHLTDIHLDTANHAPERFQRCMDLVLDQDIDLILNGGDTVMAVDYSNITRERVHELWDLWDANKQRLDGYEMYSCLGNHDMWWAAPDAADDMYGKAYAVKRLGIPSRYYHIQEKNWTIIILDSNNSPAGSLDDEQVQWLEDTLASVAGDTHVLIMSHYPIFAAICQWEGGMHTDYQKLLTLFYKFPNIKACISGHMHLLESLTYNGIKYFCNGALSGFWWGEGDESSADTYYYKQTAPGFAILDLYEDGSLSNHYYAHYK